MSGGRLVVVAALAATDLTLVGPTPVADATSLSVGDEAAYRAALATLSGDDSGPHTITLTADVELADAVDPVYSGSQPLTVDGDGHALTVTADGTRALRVSSDVAVTLEELEISGGEAPADGGAVETVGDLTVRTSYIHDNAAAGVGGGLHAGGTLTVERSTLASNVATDGGGAAAPTTEVLASTITGNTASATGGGLSAADLALDWSTVLENSAPSGANLAMTALAGRASVVAGPAGGGTNCPSPVDDTSAGFLVSDSSCLVNDVGEVVDGEPEFAALADNGGPTPTRHAEPGNPVIRSHYCSLGSLFPPIPANVPADQRGRPRGLIAVPVLFSLPRTVCDVGAVEIEELDVSVTADPATVVAGPTASWGAELLNEGPYPIARFGPLPSGCAVQGTPPVGVGESVAVVCDLSSRSAGTTVGPLQVTPASPYAPDHVLAPGIPVATFVRLAAEVRVICGANARPDVGPWLDVAMTWFDCDARFVAEPPTVAFRPRRALTRFTFARFLVDATGGDLPQNPSAPVADVPQAKRAIVRQVTADPDGDGPRVAPMTGFAGGRFRPDQPVTRAQVVNSLWRWVGRPTGFDHPFVDVPRWVEDAVAWAAANGVVTGFPGPTFRPAVIPTKGVGLNQLFLADAWFDPA